MTDMGSPFVNIHTHSKSNSPNCIELVQCRWDEPLPNLTPASAGIHPWQLDDGNFNVDKALTAIEEQIDLLAAVGEAGIDKIHKNTIELQKEVFAKQIALSERHSKPMIIHNVRSLQEIVSARRETKARQPWIVHGFSGNALAAKQLTDNGMYISIGHMLLNPNSKTAESLKSIQPNRLFAETDTAETPIEEIYSCMAEVLGIDIEKLKDIIYSNFKHIFAGQ